MTELEEAMARGRREMQLRAATACDMIANRAEELGNKERARAARDCAEAIRSLLDE